MRIHTDKLSTLDLFKAAEIARVEITYTGHGSRIRERSWDVHLTGESRRRPNDRGRHTSDEYAATWDQWGVFFAVLFDRDPNMLAGSGVKYAIYRDRSDFHWQTDARFVAVGGGWSAESVPEGYWPSDAHGDHTFRSEGMGVQRCTKCSAVKRWKF